MAPPNVYSNLIQECIYNGYNKDDPDIICILVPTQLEPAVHTTCPCNALTSDHAR